jgi:alkylation response protein AidB-like acyl-CoA dehydrogenase
MTNRPAGQPADEPVAERGAQPAGNGPATISTSLLDQVRAGAAKADAACDLDDDVYTALHEERAFMCLVPTELGGGGCSPLQWFRLGRTVGKADPAAGWIVAQGAAQNAWFAISGDQGFVAEYFAGSNPSMATSSAGRAPATRHGDTYVVRNARWAYVSGCSGSAWLGGMLYVNREDGPPTTRMAIVPARDATIERTWDTLGLRGTGSHVVDLGDTVEVPARQTFSWPGFDVTLPGRLGRAAQTLWLVALSAAAAQLGGAERALEEAVALASRKQRVLEPEPLHTQQAFIRAWADLHGQLTLAVNGIEALLGELWERAGEGETTSLADRARLRLAAARAVRVGADVVQGAAHIVGADALHRGQPLERLVRDARMLVSHVSVNDAAMQRCGEVLLGAYDGPDGLV